LTVNKIATMHRQQWATRTREIREEWWALILQAKLPRLDRIRVEITPLHKDRKSPQDCAACAAHAKPCIDALVDARVIEDDDPTHLVSVTFLPPDVCGVDGLRLVVINAGLDRSALTD